MIHFERYRKRNRTNRNLIVIIVGFLCSVLAGAFVFQAYVSKIAEHARNNPHILHITIENESIKKEIPYYLIIASDTILKKTIFPGKQSYEIGFSWDSAQTLVHIFDNKIITTPNISVPDSISYLLFEIQKTPPLSSDLQIISHFFN